MRTAELLELEAVLAKRAREDPDPAVRAVNVLELFAVQAALEAGPGETWVDVLRKRREVRDG